MPEWRRSQQGMQILADGLGAGVAEDRLGGIVPERDPAVVVDHHDGVVRRGGHRPQGLLAFAQSTFGRDPRGDIPAQQDERTLSAHLHGTGGELDVQHRPVLALHTQRDLGLIDHRVERLAQFFLGAGTIFRNDQNQRIERKHLIDAVTECVDIGGIRVGVLAIHDDRHAEQGVVGHAAELRFGLAQRLGDLFRLGQGRLQLGDSLTQPMLRSLRGVLRVEPFSRAIGVGSSHDILRFMTCTRDRGLTRDAPTAACCPIFDVAWRSRG